MLKNREEQTKCSLLKFKRDHDILQKRSKRLVLCPDAISIIGNQATDEIVLFLSPECPHCRQALFELMEYMNSNSLGINHSRNNSNLFNGGGLWYKASWGPWNGALRLSHLGEILDFVSR
jgi:hypothetical protein